MWYVTKENHAVVMIFFSAHGLRMALRIPSSIRLIQQMDATWHTAQTRETVAAFPRPSHESAQMPRPAVCDQSRECNVVSSLDVMGAGTEPRSWSPSINSKAVGSFNHDGDSSAHDARKATQIAGFERDIAPFHILVLRGMCMVMTAQLVQDSNFPCQTCTVDMFNP